MRIGNGEFWLGDCLELLSAVPDGSVDMVLCDLPYGTTACKWDSVLPFDRLWEHYWRVCKPNAAVVLTAAQPFTSALVMSQVQHFKYDWVWNKGVGVNFMHAKKQPLKIKEDVLVFSRGRTIYNPEMTKRNKPIRKSNNNVGESSGYTVDESDDRYVGKIYDEKYPSNIVEFSSRASDSRGLHPTQKPVALFEYLIKTYTDEGMLVLDNCAGSGTTAIAAERTGRRWLCIEQLAEYYYPAVGRVWQEVSK